MADSNKILRQYLLQSSDLTTLLGTANAFGGVYVGDLPEHFDPKRGPCVQITGAGGRPNPEIPPLSDDRKQVRVWADVEQYQLARQVYAAVAAQINGKDNVKLSSGYLMRSIAVTAGQDVTDPETGWATVIAFYQVMVRDN